MNTRSWNGYNSREEIITCPQNFEQVIESMNQSEAKDDFELGDPWIGDKDSQEDDPE